MPGDVDKFTALYRTNHPQVYAYAVTRAGRHQADEVVADTFLIAWRRFNAIPRDHPLPWLLAVARNVTRERFRAESRQQAITAEMQAWVQDAEDIADGVTERATVLAALTRLSEEDRELLTLIAWQGLTSTQVAKVLGCTTATYFVRLHRARRRLQAAMTNHPRLKESIR